MRIIKKHLFSWLVVASLLIVLLTVGAWLKFGFGKSNSKQNSTDKALFSFAAVGDLGATSNTNAVLEQIAKQQPSFALALGDLSYGQASESAWCSLVKSKLGETFPFELVPGNHDVQDAALGLHQGDINEFANCLPNRIPNVVGVYAQQYYFDNQNSRFIVLAPNLTIDGTKHTYAVGSPERTWLANVLDDARAKNKKWVFVAMHKNCITFGTKSCEIGEDLFNFLIESKVTMILQGHDHAYMRSRPLQHSPDCPTIKANQYNQACTPNSASNIYHKSDGSILLIDGTGGAEMYVLNFDRPEAKYFAAWHALNSDPVFGPSVVRVYANKLSVDYYDQTGQSLDHFEVTE